MRNKMMVDLIEDLDLEGLGDLKKQLDNLGLCRYFPELGKDYGWSPELLEESPDPKNIFSFYLTPKAVQYLIKHGVAFYSGFSEKEKSVHFTNDREWGSTYGSYGPGIFFMNLIFHRLKFEKHGHLYLLVGVSGDYGFGLSSVKKVGKKARKHCTNQFLEKFENFKKEKGPI